MLIERLIDFIFLYTECEHNDYLNTIKLVEIYRFIHLTQNDLIIVNN